jgi:hypothetical protein
LAYDVLGGFDEFMNNKTKLNFDWMTALPIYQHLYNTTVHSALGKLLSSPPPYSLLLFFDNLHRLFTF